MQERSLLMKLKIKTAEIKKLLDIKDIDFPKYSTQIMNLANQNSQDQMLSGNYPT